MGDRAKRVRRVGAAVALALGLALAFPFRAGELRFDFGLIVGWLALVPLLFLIQNMRPRDAFVWVSGSASLGYALVLYWIYIVVTVFGRAPAVAGVGAVIGLAAVLGVHAGLAGAAIAWLTPERGLARIACVPAAWVATEHLRGFDLFGGFPWAYLGYAAHADGPMLELAAIGGVWGLTFLMACGAALLAERRWRAALLLVCATHVVGFAARLWRPPSDETEPLRAALVQASIPQDVKWDAQLARRHFRAHVDLTRMAAAGKQLDLVLWPEASVPVFLEAQPEYREQVVRLAAEIDATLIIGGAGLRFTPGVERPEVFNSAFVVSPSLGLIDRYDKTHLVPFGEYVPLRSVLGFVSAVATGLAGIVDLTPGEAPRALNTLGGVAEAYAPTALICYEVIYPELVRRAVRSGARVLLNLTNDAWYGRSSAPHQFLAIAAMRSAEHGLPMLRAANTGISGFIDAGGVVLEQTPIFERVALADDVPPARGAATPYTRFGDWVVWLSWGILLLCGGLRYVRRNQRSGKGDPGRAARPARA